MTSTRRRAIPVSLLVLTIAATGALAGGGTDDRKTESKVEPGEPQQVRPAVLIVPVWDPPPRPRPNRRVEVIDLAERDRLRRRESQRNGCEPYEPPLGTDYGLAGEYAPDPSLPNFRYRVYVDLSDPGVARNWREFHRTVQAELRNDRWRRWSERDIARRRQRLLSTSGQAVEAGVAQMRRGDYRQAVLSLTLAAEMNHGDPMCRLHLAQARVALGHDAEAAQALLRALELQPKLVPIQLGLEQYHPSEDEFNAHVDALAERLAGRPDASGEECFLLGFLEFQRNRLDEAHAAFLRAKRDLPKDDRLAMFLKITKPAAR